MSRFAPLLLALVVLPLASSAQKVRKVSGEYTYYAPRNVSFEAAERTAVERARLQALADAFGTVVRSTTTADVSNRDGASRVDVSTLAASEVRGEWLADTKQAEVSFLGYEQHMLVFRARVWGRAREILAAPIALEAQLLRNGTRPEFESDRFRAGDLLYLAFKTPVPGYLAVYLMDGSGQARRLLPYQADREGVVRVEGDRDYVFFSERCAESELAPIVDEIYVTKDDHATNTFCIVFSPTAFTRPPDDTSDPDEAHLPRGTSVEKFRKWLAACRLRDPRMVVVERTLTIL